MPIGAFLNRLFRRQTSEYPATSREVTRDNMLFKVGVIAALQAFKDRRTGNLPAEERLAAMRELIAELARIYEIPCPRLEMEDIDGSNSGASSWTPAENLITMRGKLSIITLLHEFAHARGKDEYGAVGWSVSLFKRVYPERYDRLFHAGHMLTTEPLPETESFPEIGDRSQTADFEPEDLSPEENFGNMVQFQYFAMRRIDLPTEGNRVKNLLRRGITRRVPFDSLNRVRLLVSGHWALESETITHNVSWDAATDTIQCTCQYFADHGFCRFSVSVARFLTAIRRVWRSQRWVGINADLSEAVVRVVEAEQPAIEPVPSVVPEPQPTEQTAQPFRVVVCLNDGVCTGIFSNAPVQTLVIQADTESEDEAALVKIGTGIDMEEYYPYSSLRSGDLDQTFVDRAFQAVAEKEAANG